jgi:hypothetical protein
MEQPPRRANARAERWRHLLDARKIDPARRRSKQRSLRAPEVLAGQTLHSQVDIGTLVRFAPHERPEEPNALRAASHQKAHELRQRLGGTRSKRLHTRFPRLRAPCDESGHSARAGHEKSIARPNPLSDPSRLPIFL